MFFLASADDLDQSGNADILRVHIDMDDPQLIDAIYEASIVPEKWNEVLDRILVFSGSASGTLFVNDGHATPRWKTTERSRDAVEQFVATEAWKDTGHCQDFRVWAGIMGKKEIPYVTTQRACDTERASRSASRGRRCERRI